MAKQLIISFFEKHPHYVTNILIIFVIIFTMLWLWSGLERFSKKRKPDMLILFFIIECWFFYCKYERVKPPSASVESLIRFVANSKGKHYQLWQFRLNDTSYFELVGPWSLLAGIKTFIIFGSGPPGYIFNQEGDLIDWTYDIDEDLIYSKKWTISIDASQSREEISFEQSLKIIKEWSETHKK